VLPQTSRAAFVAYSKLPRKFPPKPNNLGIKNIIKYIKRAIKSSLYYIVLVVLIVAFKAANLQLTFTEMMRDYDVIANQKINSLFLEIPGNSRRELWGSAIPVNSRWSCLPRPDS